MDSKFHNKELSPNEVSTLHMAPVSAGRPHVTFNNLQTEGVLLSVNQSNFEMYFDLNWIFPARKSEPIGMEIEIDKKNLHLMLSILSFLLFLYKFYIEETKLSGYSEHGSAVDMLNQKFPLVVQVVHRGRGNERL